MAAVTKVWSDSACAIAITDTEAQEKGKKYILYTVDLRSATGQHWQLFRRYNEFHTLYEKMKKLYPGAQLKLPGKKFFGSNDASTVNQRKEGLSAFIQKLMNNPDLSANADVRQFLELDKPSHPTDDSLSDSHDSSDSDRVDLGQSERITAKASDFEFLKVIGKGSFGKVLLAKHKQEGNIYAVKVLNKAHILKKNEAKHIMSERNVLLKNVCHAFLVGMHYSFQSSDKLYFVLDYVNGGEMFYHLQRERCFVEPRARFYAAEMASAVGYLHSLDIIYRDLKPENILLDSEGHIALTDFGLCKEGIKDRATTSTFCGTPEYLAPEVLKKQPYDKTVDWWCLGAVLYEMMYGLPPFYSRDTSEMYKSILHQPLRFRTNAGSAQARNFLEKLLEKNKERRLGAKHDLEELKAHPFFESIDWAQLEQRQIKPPYNPRVANDMDLKHIDPDFVREPVPASVGRSYGNMGGVNANNVFDGFTYVPPVGEAFDENGMLDDRL